MGDDQDALVRLWREKRGEVEPEDLSDNLIVQLGTVTEVLNRAALNFTSDLKNILLTPVALNDAGRARRVTTQKAALLRLREKALKGDVKAFDKLLSYAMAMSGNAAEETTKSPSVDDQAILEAFRQQILSDANAAAAIQRDEEDDT